ncbi:MAG: phytoene/squalene synthase family protein, partial [Planctomycetota bacterium]
YRRCEQLARRSASNFYWAFWLLDRQQRRSMYALYAFARKTDDVVDGVATATTATTTATMTATTTATATNTATTTTAATATTVHTAVDADAKSAASLEAWREAWHAALAGEYRDPLLPAVVDTVRRRGIPPRYLDALIAGVARDLRFEPFATRGELTDYCEKVASAVGICCMHIWSNRPEPAYEAARQCGLAFQMTNILRDLREDAERGRLYLPLDEMAEHRLAPNCVLAALQRASTPNAANPGGDSQPSCEDLLITLLRRQIAIASDHYEAGWETRRFLAAGPARAFALMFTTYRELLDRIARDPRCVLVRGPRIGAARKLWLVARACWGSPAVSTP